MRCPVCRLEITDTVLVGSIAQHMCRRCAVLMIEGLDRQAYFKDLLKVLEQFIKERQVKHDGTQK